MPSLQDLLQCSSDLQLHQHAFEPSLLCRKAQGAKKLGVRASLARKLLSKRAVKSAASDLSLHESEAHKELNTNRWEEI